MKEGFETLQERIEEAKSKLEALIEYETEGIEDVMESLEDLKDNLEESGEEMVEDLEEVEESIEDMASETPKPELDFCHLAAGLKESVKSSLVEPVKSGDWEQKIAQLKSNVDGMYHDFTHALDAALEAYKNLK